MENYPFQYFPKYLNTTGIKDKILKQVTLNSDKILIGRGEELVEVEERRQTAWLSQNPNLTFTYSGKTMIPQKIPKFIEVIRLQLEEDFGINFDGILVNYYPNGHSSMGYHADPQGDRWSSDFIVISIGSERTFMFRHQQNRDLKKSYDFRDGDLIYMFDNCQEEYEHCLKKNKKDSEDRISLVFKKSISLST